MPLTKEQKASAVEEIDARLERSPVLYLTDFKGLSVGQANELRARFRQAGVEYKVIKNTLLRLAMERRGGYDELYDQLHGPTAVAFSEEPSMPARVMKAFTDDLNTERPALKAAYIDGAIYGADTLDVLTSLRSKADILSDLLGLIMAPATNIASALGAPAQDLAGALRAPAQNLLGAVKTVAEKES